MNSTRPLVIEIHTSGLTEKGSTGGGTGVDIGSGGCVRECRHHMKQLNYKQFSY